VAEEAARVGAAAPRWDRQRGCPTGPFFVLIVATVDYFVEFFVRSCGLMVSPEVTQILVIVLQCIPLRTRPDIFRTLL
jgi:hypothetical protein